MRQETWGWGGGEALHPPPVMPEASEPHLQGRVTVGPNPWVRCSEATPPSLLGLFARTLLREILQAGCVTGHPHKPDLAGSEPRPSLHTEVKRKLLNLTSLTCKARPWPSSRLSLFVGFWPWPLTCTSGVERDPSARWETGVHEQGHTLPPTAAPNTECPSPKLTALLPPISWTAASTLPDPLFQNEHTLTQEARPRCCLE